MHRNLIAALTVLVLAGCGEATTVTQGGPTSPSPAPLRLTVTAVRHIDRDGPIYLEGSIPEIRLLDANGHLVAVKRVEQGTHQVTFNGLDAGPYVLAAASLICDGNCSVIDGPADGCRSPITVDQNLAVRVDINDGIPCRIST